MANYQYTQDLINDVLNRTSEPLTGSDYQSQALQYINRNYSAIAAGGIEWIEDDDPPDWEWLFPSPGTLTLLPKVTTGTVAVTLDSATVTFSSAPAVSVTGYFFKTTNNKDVYRISAHTAASPTATLDSAFTGATNAADTYELVPLEYTLETDLIRIITNINIFRDNREITGMALEELTTNWPIPPFNEGDPENFAMIGEQKIRVSHVAKEKMRADYMYLQIPPALTNSVATEEPLVPLRFRQVIADAAVFNIMIDKQDSRADGVGQRVKRGIEAMLRDHKKRLRRQSRNFGQIEYRQRQVNSRLLRTTSGIIIRP